MATSKQVKIYRKMQEELAQYNRDLTAGKSPLKRQYDPEVFLAFRKWQQHNLRV